MNIIEQKKKNLYCNVVTLNLRCKQRFTVDFNLRCSKQVSVPVAYKTSSSASIDLLTARNGCNFPQTITLNFNT